MLDKFDKKTSPFKVPQNYFENFNADMLNNLPEKEVQKARIVPLWKKVVPWSAVAAAFAGILFMTGILKPAKTSFDVVMLNSGEKVEIPLISPVSMASVDEEDYYLFLEEEVSNSQFKEMMYN